MAMTLPEMKVGMTDKLQSSVVDTFIRESEVLELIPFDNSLSPNGGSTLTYGYIQKKLPSATSFRAINEEFAASQATVEKKSVDLKIFGGSFELDRVIKQAEGMYNNMALQLEEKVISAVGTFHNAMINGDSSSDAEQFDGLDKFLVGQSTEFGTAAVIDLSTMAKVKENADVFYEELLKLINRTGAHALFVNEGMKTKIQTVARVLGYKTESKEDFGRTITTIGEGNVRLVDLKNIVTVSGGAAVDPPSLDFNFSTPESAPAVEAKAEPAPDFNFTFDSTAAAETKLQPTTEPEVIALPSIVPEPAATFVGTDVDLNDPLVKSFPDLSQVDEIQLNLDLASQYVELGAYDAAKALLGEQDANYSAEQRQRADQLLNQIAS